MTEAMIGGLAKMGSFTGITKSKERKATIELDTRYEHKVTTKEDWAGDDTKFSWDYCLAFKILTPEQEEEKNQSVKPGKKRFNFAKDTTKYIQAIQQAGLKTYCYLSVQEDEVYCLIGITEKRLREEADRLDYDLPLDINKVIQQGLSYGPNGEPLPLLAALQSHSGKDRYVAMDKWELRTFYGPYNKFSSKLDGMSQKQALAVPRETSAGPLRAARNRQELYQIAHEQDPHRHVNTFFRPIDRNRLIFNILEAPREVGVGAGMSLFRLKRSKKSPLVEAFPLHKEDQRRELEVKWMKFWPLLTQPLDDIRTYFGEKVGMYFAFLEFYTTWLIIPAILGCIVFVEQITASFQVDVKVLPFAGVAVALWSALFLEFWKRREAELRCDWGQNNFVEKEPVRPEFVGETIRDPTSGERVKFFSFWKRAFRMVQSFTLLWILIGCVISMVLGIMALRIILKEEYGDTYGAGLGSFINFMQIQMMNFLYGMVANKLNDYENHKTATDYENALIFKSFLFRFVNSYNSFFYLAFFKRIDPKGGCAENDPYCLQELQLNLAIIFGSSIAVGNFMEVVLPYLCYLRKSRANASEDTSKVKTDAEVQAEFRPYTTFYDYDEMVIQFGYVTIFVVAFPMAPLMAVLNNFFEIRIDAHKILRATQRPQPQGAASIGTWFDILSIVSFIAVLVNTVICVFFTKVVDNLVDGNFPAKALLFVASEHVIILLKMAIAYFVLDESDQVREHNARNEFLVNALIKGVPAPLDNGQDDSDSEDDDADEDDTEGFEPFDYNVLPKTFEDKKSLEETDFQVSSSVLTTEAGSPAQTSITISAASIEHSALGSLPEIVEDDGTKKSE